MFKSRFLRHRIKKLLDGISLTYYDWYISETEINIT